MLYFPLNIFLVYITTKSLNVLNLYNIYQLLYVKVLYVENNSIKTVLSIQLTKKIINKLHVEN